MDLHLSRPQGETPERHDPAHPTPAALVAGQVPATDALHPLSAFDMFRIGIGPSSSHTAGPMRAGLAFAAELAALEPRGVSRVGIDLLGSLGATGRGHNTDRAVLLGLAGHDPATVPTAVVESVLPEVARTGGLTLVGGHRVPFDVDRDIRFLPRTRLPYHVNALTITAWPDPPRTSPAEAPSSGPLPPTDAAGSPPLLRRTYYSVGGGFVMVQTNDDPEEPVVESLATAEATSTLGVAAPHPFATSAELLERCAGSGLSIAALVRTNEESMRSPERVDAHLDLIADEMFACIEEGVSATGLLPGGLDVPRRAHALADQLRARSSRRTGDGEGGGPGAGTGDGEGGGPGAGTGEEDGRVRRGDPREWASTPEDPMRAMDWVNLFALAVNEENAAGHRVVTAPTNGAAGVLPAVLGYLVVFCPEAGVAHPAAAPLPGGPLLPRLGGTGDEGDEGGARRRRAVHDFLLAATAIGALIKTNASIAGAEVGCQGEVGSASAMAAAGLAQALGGTPHQVENAAEIAMEHSLGLTCDPVGGLVQIPCIERNAIAAVKAINAARMALWGDGRHTVSLDVVIETMRQTGNDMLSKYKETSAGGLAVNVVEC